MERPIEIAFRAFEAGDLPVLHAWLRAAGLGVPDRVDPAVWGRRLLSDARILLTTAVAESAPIGFVRLDLAPDRTAEITVLVDPARRRRGVGRKLLRYALDAARSRDLRRLFAVVADHNDVGRNFFIEEGFELSGAAVPGFDHLERYVHRSDRQSPLEIVP